MLQRAAEERQRYCQEAAAYSRDVLKPFGQLVLKRRLQRCSGIRAWHGKLSFA